MAWVYSQFQGTLHHVTYTSVEYVGAGYAGEGAGLNRPDKQDVRDTDGAGPACKDAGPIVRGLYTIGTPVDSHGGFALPLSPDASNEMHGRGGFLIHGDLKDQTKPFQASLGCIILPRAIRERIWASNDRLLLVVA